MIHDAQRRRAGGRTKLATPPVISAVQGLLASTALALVVGGAIPAQANPTDPTVRAGDVSIREDGRVLTVDQGSARAIIDWRGFSIAGDETTRFNQPSAAAIALNRVTGADPSHIFGRLEANGQVMLVNPNGIVFGAASRVDVAGLVATTADIRDDDFLAGRLEFTIPSPNPDAAVVNHGRITVAEAGYAALVAPSVRNAGTIDARLGRITLAGAEGFALDLYGDNLVVFRVPVDTAPRDEAGNPVPALVHNSGNLIADGGTVTLAAQQVGSVVRSVVNTDGLVQANTVDRQGGRIVLGVAGEGDVDVSGTVAAADGVIEIAGDRVTIAEGTVIDARGQVGSGEITVAALDDATIRMALLAAAHIEIAADLDRSGWGDGAAAASGGTALLQDATLDASAAAGQGGTVIVTGDHVILDGASVVDTSGPAGGGTVLIGGDYLGRGDLRTADAAGVGQNVVIRADATEAGDGGRVILWSDDVTLFDGRIFARGGAAGGDGGFIETSGSLLRAHGLADASAPAGKSGMWLLDPFNVTIAASAPTCPNGNCSLVSGSGGLHFSPINHMTIDESQIKTALNAGTNVEITTGSGGAGSNIFVQAAIQMSGASDATLSLISGGSIFINAPIESTGAGALSVSLDAGSLISINQAIETNGGSLQAIAPTITVGATIETGNGAVSLTGSTINQAAQIETTGGNIDIAAASGSFFQSADITSTSGRIRISAGQVTLAEDVTSVSGEIVIAGGSSGVQMDSGAEIDAGSGAVDISGTLTLAAGSFNILSDGGGIALDSVIGDAAGSTLHLDAGAGAITAHGFDLGNAGELTAIGGTIATGTLLRANEVVLTGQASGTGLVVASLTVSGPGADLQGTVAGQGGAAAARATVMPDTANHLVNGCRVSGCTTESALESGVPASALDPTRLVPSPADSVPPPSLPAPSVDRGDGSPNGAPEAGSADVVPENEVAVIESGSPSGGPRTGSNAAIDPALMPGFDTGLADLSRLLQNGDMDHGELRRIADELDDPAIGDLARELLTLLDGGGAAADGGVPQDAFGGTAAVVVPGLVTYRPAASGEGTGVAVAGVAGVFQPPGFALFQF